MYKHVSIDKVVGAPERWTKEITLGDAVRMIETQPLEPLYVYDDGSMQCGNRISVIKLSVLKRMGRKRVLISNH